MKKIFFLLSTLSICAFSEEGMWPLHQVPKSAVTQKYGIELDNKWLEAVQNSCLRISSGGSGSFVSSSGLVLTNHHVGASAIHNLSSKDQNYFEQGFYAKTLDQEIPCPNLYVDQLIRVVDVTDEVNQKIEKKHSFSEKEKLRKEAIAEIQRKAKDNEGLQPEIVTLYHGAKYYLYLYKRYSDVRLVMAPEKSVASLGGDIDNFEYPRYSLDMCFFRVYHDGKPLQVEDYFSWSKSGPKEGELLFVSGHPGKTKRMLTAEHLRFFEEVEMPWVIRYIKERIDMLKEFSSKGVEEKRIAEQMLHSLCNAFKVYNGLEKGFKYSSPIDWKSQKDESLYKKKSDKAYEPWRKVDEALSSAKSYIHEYLILEGIGSNYSKLYSIAKSLVRLSAERKLPNEKRLLEYVDTEIDKLKLKIVSKEPFYSSLEEECLKDSFERLSQVLGENHPCIKELFKERSAKQLASEIIKNTSLFDEKERARLFENLESVEFSKDPLIAVVKLIDPYARKVRAKKEDHLDGLLTECYAAIAALEFESYGESVYPDATFSLRISFGEMKGYENLSPTTTFEEMYKHVEKNGGKDPFCLPSKWSLAKGDLQKNVSLNFVSTHDIIGGNSGSPVFNKERQIVGLIFDGNAHSIAWSHRFDDKLGRAISVHSQGMLEALQRVYQADRLVEEIQRL